MSAGAGAATDRRAAVGWAAAVFVLALAGLVWSTLANGPLIHRVENSFLEPPPAAPPSPWPTIGPVEVAIAGAGGLAVIALVANKAARESKRIEFKEEWFDPDRDETPEGVKPDVTRYKT